MRTGQEEMCLCEDAADHRGDAENAWVFLIISPLWLMLLHMIKTKVAHVWVKSTVTGVGHPEPGGH